MTLQVYAQRQVSGLIDRVAAGIGHLSRARDAEAIHDLRVSIRRLTQSLRAFAGVLPKKEARKARREMKTLMNLAGEVRSRDIALELFEAAGVARTSAPCVRLMLEREDAIAALAALAAAWDGAGFPAGVRQRLDLQ